MVNTLCVLSLQLPACFVYCPLLVGLAISTFCKWQAWQQTFLMQNWTEIKTISLTVAIDKYSRNLCVLNVKKKWLIVQLSVFVFIFFPIVGQEFYMWHTFQHKKWHFNARLSVKFYYFTNCCNTQWITQPRWSTWGGCVESFLFFSKSLLQNCFWSVHPICVGGVLCRSKILPSHGFTPLNHPIALQFEAFFAF